MNYLAHAYLSFRQPSLLAGNMISDFVRGKKKFDYPLAIQKGISLHRAIDSFTDDHAATREMKQVFKSNYGLYSGAFADIVYDHFLANDANQFKDQSLLDFSSWVYHTLEPFLPTCPESFQQLFPYMKMHNWLYNYRLREGIARSFNGLVRRAKYMDEGDTAFVLFEEHYDLLSECYKDFFPELEKFSRQYIQ
jgi:acyl carrier protein phosphodiesterase